MAGAVVFIEFLLLSELPFCLWLATCVRLLAFVFVRAYIANGLWTVV
jgi:hypothetical protein